MIRRRILKRVAILIGILIVVLVIADMVVLPISLGIYAGSSAKSDVGDPPPGFTQVTVAAADGVLLAGWYAPPGNGTAVILLPGAGGSREAIREQGAALAARGFGVLAVDPRGAGESQGQTNRFGWAGTRDVGGAVAFLERLPEVERIAGWGFSMGGEMLLGAISTYPQITAVITDGATHRSYAEKFDLDSQRMPTVQFYSWMQYTAVEMVTGEEPPMPTILESIRANTTTRLLLIAAGTLEDEIAYTRMFADAAGDRAEVWVVPDVGHTGAWEADRDDYIERVAAVVSR